MLRPFSTVRFALIAALALLVASCAMDRPAHYPPRSFFVFFATDSAELSPEAMVVLNRVADEARAENATGVGIVGYSSPTGTPAHNLRLSEQRAAAVEAGLLTRGVPRDILVRTYHGATAVTGPEPLEGQRVEIVVTREEKR